MNKIEVTIALPVSVFDWLEEIGQAFSSLAPQFGVRFAIAEPDALLHISRTFYPARYAMTDTKTGVLVLPTGPALGAESVLRPFKGKYFEKCHSLAC